ncbi:MAG: diguanylate cyclase [Eubacteriales bacterium]
MDAILIWDKKTRSLSVKCGGNMLTENTRTKDNNDRFGITILEWDLVNQGFTASDSFFKYKMSESDPQKLLKTFDKFSDVHPDDFPMLKTFFEKASTGQTKEGIMVRFQAKDEAYYWTVLSARFFFDGLKEPSRVIVTLLDIDEETFYNQQLEKENQMLQGILEGISLGVGIFEINGDVIPTYLSDKACAIFGYTNEEMDARIEKRTPIYFKLNTEEDPLSQIPADLFSSLIAGETVESKISVKRKDGVWIWLHVLGTLSRKKDEKTYCYITMRDISALAKDGNERNWQAERYRILSESEQVVTFEYETEADTLDYSIYTEAGVLKNIHIDKFLEGLSEEKRVHPDSKALVQETFRKAQETHSSNSIDILADFYSRDYRWWRLRFASVIDDVSGICYVVGRADDVQAEKDNEAKLLASLDKEASFRRSITAGAILALEFDIESGKRVVSRGDILPQTIAEDITLDSLVEQLMQRAHPEDMPVMEEYDDVRKIMRGLSASKRKISFDYRSRTICDRYQGYRWLGITYMYAVPNKQGYKHVLIYIIDINEKKNTQLMLMDQAKHDPLTGLLNRAAFKEYFTELISSHEISDGHKSLDAFVMIDMNSLQEINDTYGYAFGDKMLKSVAITLQAMRCESAARLDGDKFALCIHDIPTEEVLREQMRILSNALTQKVNETVTLSAAIGISIYPTDAKVYDELYEKADQALCAAKKMGNREFAFYSSDIGEADYAQEQGATSREAVNDEKRVFIRTFGYFDVFVNGQAIPFKVVKAKELLALLVDRRGGFLSASDAISFLWEDEPANELTLSRYRKVAMRLKSILADFGIEDIIESINGLRRVIPEKFECDYYAFVSTDAKNRAHFPGAYLTNYSWGENTLSILEEMSE